MDISSQPCAELSTSQDHSGRSWGSQEWFHHLWRSQKAPDDQSAYFALSSYHRHRHEQMLSVLKRAKSLGDRDAALDIGCGTGHFAELLRRELGYRSTLGIDFVDELLDDNARKYPDVEFRAGSLPYLEFPDESFDLVVAAEVLYYLSEEDRALALEEIHRVLKRRGNLLFTSAIGDIYFTVESARQFLSCKFNVAQQFLSHNWLYNASVGRLCALNRLHQLLENGDEPGTENSRQWLKSKRWLTDRLAFRWSLAAACAACGPILSAKWPPWLFDSVCRQVAPGQTKTNVTILCSKK